MKNFFLSFSLALLVVLSGVSIRQSVAGIGGAPMPVPTTKAHASVMLGIGGAPMPVPTKPR